MFRSRQLENLGAVIARSLSGAWRENPPELECSTAELENIRHLLLSSGAGALVWRRIQKARLEDLMASVEFRDAYRIYTLQSALDRRHIAEAFRLFRSHSLEPVLIKGWSIGRLYPEPGLRPRGDIDFCLHPEQYAAGRKALKQPGAWQYNVDLHRGFAKFDGSEFQSIYQKSELVPLNDADARVPCMEDHLRVLCMHFMRHGGSRPLWLCDIALVLERRSADFDWDRCLGREKRVAGPVSCAIDLAGSLLGACIDNTPGTSLAKGQSAWVASTVLRQWGAGFAVRTPARACLRRPRRLVRELRNHWPNALEATIRTGAPMVFRPRLALQMGNSAIRTGRFLWNLAVPRTEESQNHLR